MSSNVFCSYRSNYMGCSLFYLDETITPFFVDIINIGNNVKIMTKIKHQKLPVCIFKGAQEKSSSLLIIVPLVNSAVFSH